MHRVTIDLLQAMTPGADSARARDNMRSIALGFEEHAARFGLDLPHRAAHFLAQVAHESGSFRYDQEVWGPTPAQKRYEDRKDLGHSSKIPGEAKKFAGEGPMQLTGRHNVRAFEAWCVEHYGREATPRFEDDPDLIHSDPWEFLSAVWYWECGNPTGKSLNRYADRNDIETVTKRVNGGLNGFSDRLRYFARAGLALLGYGVDEAGTKAFQGDAGLLVDGDAGPQTRDALFKRLRALSDAPAIAAPAEIPAAPAVEPARMPVARPILDGEKPDFVAAVTAAGDTVQVERASIRRIGRRGSRPQVQDAPAAPAAPAAKPKGSLLSRAIEAIAPTRAAVPAAPQKRLPGIAEQDDTVRQVQHLLRAAGHFAVGEVDGLKGDSTDDAILAFRRRADLPLNTDIDTDFLAALARATPKPIAASRARATAKDIADSPGVKTGEYLKLAGGILGITGLGTAGSDIAVNFEHALATVNKVKALTDAVMGALPQLGIAVAGIVVFVLGYRVVSHLLEGYRAGRHV